MSTILPFRALRPCRFLAPFAPLPKNLGENYRVQGGLESLWTPKALSPLLPLVFKPSGCTLAGVLFGGSRGISGEPFQNPRRYSTSKIFSTNSPSNPAQVLSACWFTAFLWVCRPGPKFSTSALLILGVAGGHATLPILRLKAMLACSFFSLSLALQGAAEQLRAACAQHCSTHWFHGFVRASNQ